MARDNGSGTLSEMIIEEGGAYVGGFRDGALKDNSRFSIADGANSNAKLVLKGGSFRCSKNTNGGNQTDALCIATGSGSTGIYEHQSGQTVVDGFMYVGRGANSTATGTQDAGEVRVNGQFVLADGNGSSATYVQNGGTLISTGFLCLGSIHNDSYTADFTLNGGEVQNTGNVVTMASRGGTGSMATLTINDGTFSSVSDLWLGENGSATVNLNGGVADFSKGWVRISRYSSAADETHTLNLNGGVLALNAGYEFGSPLVLGAHGAIAVDISTLVTAANEAETPLAVGDEITLFTVPKGLSFADDADSLATTVFLYGKMVGYEVFMDEDGTTVKARLTDVSKIGVNSAVTVFRGAADGGDPSHVDQTAAFNNGVPDNGRYDLVFFPYDAILHVWADAKNINNRRMGQLVVRDTTIRYAISNGNFPNLDALNLSGRGTVMFTQTGCRLDNKNDGAIHVAPTVNLAFDNTGVAHGQDNWIGGDGETAPAIVDGDVYATNGVLRLYSGAIINGTIHCASYDVASHVNDDGVVLNGGLVVSTGGTFDFKNKATTIGENAKLVYDGGKVVNFGSLAFPSVEVTSSVYLYTDLMKDADTVITVNGGEVTMPLELAEDFKPVVMQAGGVRFDVSAKTDLVEGSVLSLDAFKLADGVTFDDIAVALVGSAFDWNIYVDAEDETVKATAYTASSSNKWIGGPSGLYSEKAHWNFPQYIRFDAMEGTVKFGSMTLMKDCHIETQLGSTLVLEVGALNTDFTLNSGIIVYRNSTVDWQDAWTRGSPTVTIKKVGTGTMSAGFAYEAHVTVAEGTFAINQTDEQLAVEVAAGATVTATADVTVGSVTFATGAQVLLASADAAEVHPIAVKGAVDVTGVRIVPTEAVADELRTQEDGDATEYAVLVSEAGLTGEPDGAIAAVCEDAAYGWKAQVVGQTLQLRRKYVKPGFFIIVK